jgi:predicted 3-demethylubiquinone-9 3-methyltransferase (glyoxalase superfamily)
MANNTQKITTYLTFESRAKEAVDFYTSVFKNSEIHTSMVMPGTDTLLHASFSLDGQEFMAMDGGPHFKFEQGTSLFVTCQDQEEVDYFWDKLAEGGQHLDCGWLKDQFGLSWQVVPAAMGQLMSGPDPEKSQRVMQAMMKMQKIVIADLQKAYDQA